MKEMLTMRKRVTVLLGIVAAVFTVAVAAQTDVTGKWDMTFDTDQGSTSATLTLQQDGESFSGSLGSDQGTFEFEVFPTSGWSLPPAAVTAISVVEEPNMTPLAMKSLSDPVPPRLTLRMPVTLELEVKLIA